MPRSAHFPLRPLLLAIAITGCLAIILVQFFTARRDRLTTELLRLENQSLTQEVRLLHQNLEAERILAAAQFRRLHETEVAEDRAAPNP